MYKKVTIEISEKNNEYIFSIVEIIGKIDALIKEGKKIIPTGLKLARESNINSIRNSLAIENIKLPYNEISSVINGKSVTGDKKNIQEVKNAYSAYEYIREYNPYSYKDILYAHYLMLNKVERFAGKIRDGGVGVTDNNNDFIYKAPSFKNVEKHLKSLLEFIKKSTLHPVILSCIFHYEFEKIHPFFDGNGRVGRLWQNVLLYNFRDIFEYVSIETILYKNRKTYYSSIQESTKADHIEPFLTFMLETILTALNITFSKITADENVQKLMEVMRNNELSASELMKLIGLKRRATLKEKYIDKALFLGLIEMTDKENPKSRNQKYRAIIPTNI